MTRTVPLVTIFGGSGFVGRYITRRLARDGWRVRVAVRRPNQAHFVRTYGNVGQVEPVQANIRDDASVARAVAGADVVINCVGILAAIGRQSFGAVQAEGAGRIARHAKEAGARRMIHISAIGADANSDSEYARSKAAGEAAVTGVFPDAVILRPSIVVGPEDSFFNRFAGMARLSPVVPMVGADTKFQPVYVDDVAAAAQKAVDPATPGGVYELGGPEVATFRELMQRMLEVVRRRRALVNLPMGLARLQAKALDMLQGLSGGLFSNTLLTVDQVKQLGHDNVVSEGAKGFADLGIAPVPMGIFLESYLYAYRPQGQYTEITDSARDLRIQD
ncbi:complex I NDUFA9 subunit family protein [Oceanicella sp. SM1341]|uniref:complex I NDUFA9 subunit family protein n=1 Tax=Oceanicella sp. SM1341 TaxID=1548889 RepID=UPI000E4880D8|nr:complex I NDUFA9 subunit family protein [Oceanicella sp. SM1341]